MLVESDVDEGTGRVDGRTARSLRTRQAVIDAMLGLIEDGDLRPTAPRIAERAGVSLRTVFQHFCDLDTLFIEAAKHHFTAHFELHRTVPRDLPTAERIDAFAAQRCSLYEVVAPVRMAAEVNEAFSADGLAVLTLTRASYRSELEWLFEAEFDALGEHRLASIDAADAATCCAAWRHQNRLGHANEQVAAAMALTLRRLLLP